MTKKLIIAAMALLLAVDSAMAIDRSDNMKPRWLTSALPTPKSPGYFFVRSQGSGKSLEEARQMALVNLASKIETEHGLEITSELVIEKSGQRRSGFKKNSNFTLEAKEKGKRIDLTCRVVDDYWELKYGTYYVTELFTVNDPSKPGKGSSGDNIKLTTSYGAAPVFYSLIPGVGQMYKGSTTKGGIILGSAVVVGAGIITAESLRASYVKKMKEYPQHLDFYNNKATTWKNVRNVTLGVGAGLYVYNLIDAAVAPGRRRVIVSKGKSYNYSLVPTWNGQNAELAFMLNF